MHIWIHWIIIKYDNILSFSNTYHFSIMKLSSLSFQVYVMHGPSLLLKVSLMCNIIQEDFLPPQGWISICLYLYCWDSWWCFIWGLGALIRWGLLNYLHTLGLVLDGLIESMNSLPLSVLFLDILSEIKWFHKCSQCESIV